MRWDAAEDRPAVLGDAAVDDHQMADPVGHAIGHQARDQAAEAVADQHDVTQVVLFEGGDGVGEEGVVVDVGGELRRALADATIGQGARVMARGAQPLEDEFP